MANSDEPLLSVIVAVGDYSRFLLSYLRSLPLEISSEIEFIFIINTSAEAASFQEYFKNLQIKHRILCGIYDNPGTARNAGLDVCNGKWITFHDVDDQPNIDKILNLTLILNNGDYEIGCGAYITSTFQDGKLIETFRWTRKEINDVARRPGIWRMIFKRSLIISERFLPLSMGEDQHFLILIGFARRKILFSNDQIYNYKVGVPNQLTSNKKKLTDLVKVQKSEKKIVGKLVDKREIRFSAELILRQSITLMKAFISPIPTITSFYFSLKTLIASSLRLVSPSQSGIHKTDVLVFLTGGLGNQMFQISAALALADGRNVKVLPWGSPSMISGIAESETLVWPSNLTFASVRTLRIRRVISYLMRRGLTGVRAEFNPIASSFRLILKFYVLFSGYGWVHVHINSGIGYAEIENIRAPVFIIGYFQSHNYPDLWHDEYPIKFIKNGSINEFEDQFLVDKIAIHIRLGDYLKEDKFGIPDENYYLRGIQMIPNSDQISIDLYTNSPELIVDLYPGLPWSNINVQYSENESSVSVLTRMSQYRYLIIGNSTFSWWAAYLSHQKELVIYPSPWFKELEIPSRLCPESWLPCQVSFLAPLQINIDSEK